MDQISLNYEASAGDTHKQVVTSLPPEVVQCLENARFVRFWSWDAHRRPSFVMIASPCPPFVSLSLSR